MSGCSSNNQSEIINKPIQYDFSEPLQFPFEVNEAHSEIGIKDGLHQFVYHYLNKETTQEIKYILSKVIDDEPYVFSEKEKMQPIDLKNGTHAYYKEDEYSQSIWWESENGFIARFVYYINGKSEALRQIQINSI
ncbi:hypothetical protein [Paenibacillus glycanilyticus]|uniref:Lipoprotein n=1 Tax=Paenibacillus glycanilyticus TaxID=126569 RepID=A0ABQ6G5S4_9BACL|nr:hypothetical protein [Paenibacillus glycanilyticus]GLX65660.1 hypothetical protein MU1_00040 [Paenibacillus glycanilyticus]